jgi:hypothetical protein
MQAGYVCGLVNGLKLARSVISGEEAILEREEVQPASDNSTKLILQKVDINGGTQGFVMITFDDKGALLKLDQI